MQELVDTMDLAYLTGQRPGDVLRHTWQSITDEALLVRQGKTKKFLRVMFETDGERN